MDEVPPAGEPRADVRRKEAALVQREVLVLVVLGAIAVIAFTLTRIVAAANRELRLRDAVAWSERGGALQGAGRVSDAVQAFRRASALDPDNRRYRLALAVALTDDGRDDLARQVLIALREPRPEDPQVNLELARLTARQQDRTAALRYYQSAIYGVWSPNRDDERRAVRVELIDYLLSRGERSAALSQLLALAATLPDDAASRGGLGRLFLQADDPGRALDEFQRTLARNPKDPDALAGAGEAAFHLADYNAARRYLTAAPDSDRVGELRTLTRLVLENDPLAPRLALAARVRRLQAGFTHAAGRLDACLVARAATQPAADEGLASLQAEAGMLGPTLEAKTLREAPETIEAALRLIFRIETATADACPPADPLDRALVLIGRRHKVDES